MPLTIEWGGYPFTTVVTKQRAAYIDANGYIWDAASIGVNGSSTPSWWGGYGVYGSTSGGSTFFVPYGQPIYQDNGQPYPYNAGCHLAFYVVPTEPRLTFAYYDGTTWKFATIKDTGVTGDPLPTVSAGTNPYLHQDPSCNNLWSNPGYGPDRAFVSTTNAGVAWDLTPPTVPFALPFHQEYR